MMLPHAMIKTYGKGNSKGLRRFHVLTAQKRRLRTSFCIQQHAESQLVVLPTWKVQMAIKARSCLCLQLISSFSSDSEVTTSIALWRVRLGCHTSCTPILHSNVVCLNKTQRKPSRFTFFTEVWGCPSLAVWRYNHSFDARAHKNSCP